MIFGIKISFKQDLIIVLVSKFEVCAFLIPKIYNCFFS